MCDYILEERQVDISAMKENLINYKEAEREALTIEIKIKALEYISELQANVDELKLKITDQEYLKHRINLDINLLEQAECARHLAEEEREASRIEELLGWGSASIRKSAIES